MPSPAKKFPIIGIGASAGGIQALEGFFKGIESDCGMAFVIVTHLSPDRESLLHEIVGRYTDMPVHIAEDGAQVVAEQVYVLPENAILGIDDGRLTIRRPNSVQRERHPIDIFFSALAVDQGEYAAGIVLSGGDGDGTLGVKAIKERGGLTLAQTPDGFGPRHPDMPEAAISSGLIDIAVPADEMGGKLASFARGFGQLADLVRDDAKGAEEERRKAADTIYDVLRSQAGHDFSGYKTKTFLRRVNRRMRVVQTDTIAAYAERLRRDPSEVASLFRDLLINVTNFFRDADAFAALSATVIPSLFEKRGADAKVRIWVPGCATGEEVYSLAILMREHMAGMSAVPNVQIFATDIDEAALTVARAGRYPEPLLDGVSPERRARWFTNEGGSFVVAKEVRELCIFSPHSVIRDPPFSQMDMVSCRNLLIYFGPDVQGRVVPIFHYALKPGGYLFLGTSESIGQHGDLFTTLDKKCRLFQKRQNGETRPPPFSIGDFTPQHLPTSRARHTSHAGFPLRQTVSAHVLERFSPAHVVVDAAGEVVYYSARTGRYLETPQGVPSRHLLGMARKGLRLDLGQALRDAMQGQQTIVRENVAIEEDDDHHRIISLTVEPLNERGTGGEQLYLVLFADAGPVQSKSEAARLLPNDGDAGRDEVERDLRDARERLQATIEEYETAVEELKSSNEELVSVNEELQSANEELEASKEEMQSLNEELSTINAELSDKVGELDRANTDLTNLFASTQIATVFLDRDLVIRSFTPAAARFFNLIPGDAGRPLTDLSGHLAYPAFAEHIQQVFDNGEMIEHQLARDTDGEHFLVRLIPYNENGGMVRGVVITIIDVTSITEAEAHQKVLIAELNHRVKNMLTVSISIANRTREDAPSVDAYHEALTGRLQAMARSYELLSRAQWTDASLRDIVTGAFAHFGLEKVTITGPDLRLKPKPGMALGMILHELSTNAAKYGALSVPDGQIKLRWSRSVKNRRLRFQWRESDGPEIAKPERRGFGLRLIEGETRHSLSGEAKIDFNPTGLTVAIEFPLDD